MMTHSTKYYGTVEILADQNAAIVALFDEHNDWVCAGRIETRARDLQNLYERAYDRAVFAAETHGGRLERFTVTRIVNEPRAL